MEQKLTEDNHSFGPALSPDGTTVAYLHIKSDTCEGCVNPAEYEIYLMNADGTDAHEATAIDTPVTLSWSPDGKSLAYAEAVWNSLFLRTGTTVGYPLSVWRPFENTPISVGKQSRWSGTIHLQQIGCRIHSHGAVPVNLR